MPSPLRQKLTSRHLVPALCAAVVAAALLAYFAHNLLGLSRADIREDALTGAGAILAFLALAAFAGIRSGDNDQV